MIVAETTAAELAAAAKAVLQWGRDLIVAETRWTVVLLGHAKSQRFNGAAT